MCVLRGRSVAKCLALSRPRKAVNVMRPTMHTEVAWKGASPGASPGAAPGSIWTTERVDQLRNCVIAGLTCSEIAGEIGVSRNAVIGKLHRLGLSTGGKPG